MPAVAPGAATAVCRDMPRRVGVGGTCPFENRFAACPGAITGGMLGKAIEGNRLGPACADPERDTGGALWITGCSWLSLVVRGFMTISAGFDFPPS